MQVLVHEKRRFNFVMLGLLAVAIGVWVLRMVQEGAITPPF